MPNKSPSSTDFKAFPKRATRSASWRRPPTSGWPLLKLKLRSWWRSLLEKPRVFVALFIVATALCMMPQRLWRTEVPAPGTQAGRTWIADRAISVVDAQATQQLQERARQEVSPLYELDRGAEDEFERALTSLFTLGRDLLSQGLDRQTLESDLQARLSLVGGLEVSSAQIARLRELSFASELEERLSAGAGRVLRQGIVADKELLLEHRLRGITLRELPSGSDTKVVDLYRYLDYPDQVREMIEVDLQAWDGLKARDRRLWSELLINNLAPNLTFNGSATLALRNAAAQSVGTVAHTFAKNDVIVRKWEVVDELKARALRELAGQRDLGGLALSSFGILLMVGTLALLLGMATHRELRSDRSRARLLSESLILLTASVVATALGAAIVAIVGSSVELGLVGSSSSYLFALPFAAMAAMTVLLFGRNLALVQSLIFSLICGPIVGGDGAWTTLVYCLASSLGAVWALDRAQFLRRSVLTHAGLLIGLINAFAALVLRLLPGRIEGGLAQLGFDLVCAFLGGLLATALAGFSHTVFESLFGVTTSIRLIELANPNLPLLRRLAFEAPGSFQHSVAVAHLVKAGVEAIDGDAILAHTAALYHDVGKIYRPHYFVENQPPGHNPHDKVQPSISALVLISHVKDGLELAEKYDLPEKLLEAIEQHHGTRLIKYFFNRAQERSDTPIREEDFRYPGPKPQSKEMGVLMLADAVEAASRTLIEPNQQKLRNVLCAVFDDCLNDNQLDQTDLTLGDLKKVEESFLRVLSNLHHRRIDYPGFDFNRPRGRSQSDSRVIKVAGGRDKAQTG